MAVLRPASENAGEAGGKVPRAVSSLGASCPWAPFFLPLRNRLPWLGGDDRGTKITKVAWFHGAGDTASVVAP